MRNGSIRGDPTVTVTDADAARAAAPAPPAGLLAAAVNVAVVPGASVPAGITNTGPVAAL